MSPDNKPGPADPVLRCRDKSIHNSDQSVRGNMDMRPRGIDETSARKFSLGKLTKLFGKGWNTDEGAQSLKDLPE